MRQAVAAILFALVFTGEAFAQCSFSRYVGWTIIYSGKVTGFYQDHGKQENDFQGCSFGRVLILDYTKAVKCTSYSYAYAFQPDILVLANGPLMTACIDGNMYEISRQ